MSEVCNQCWGRGKLIVKEDGKQKVIDCPYCGDLLGVKGGSLSGEEKEAKLEILIPEYYKNNPFRQELVEPPKGISRGEEFERYTLLLTEFLAKIMNRQRIERSLLIHAPQNSGKQHWVYSCITACIDKGYSVTPFIDTGELISHLDKKDNTEDLPEEFCTSDFCFIKLKTGLLKKRDLHAVRILLDRRARRDKLTVITSRYSYKYLNDVDSNFVECISPNGDKYLGNYSKLLLVSIYGNANY